LKQPKDPEAVAVSDVAEQVCARSKEIIVSAASWKLCSLHLQEAVNFATYDLIEPPEKGGRGKLIIARKRVRSY
jgi:hypothetical protein